MPKIKTKLRRSLALTDYRGKSTKTGNSSGFRFEGAVFAFLYFPGQNTFQSPQQIRPLEAKLAKRIARLTKGIRVSPDEPLKGDVIL